MRLLTLLGLAAAAVTAVEACDSCYGPADYVQHKRLVRRMQPEALNATSKPRGPLAWGQFNVLHTTDTHGWLEGHLKEKNYGADWGDFVSFVKHMRQKADELNVDLLLIDTGDLHDGAGLSDATDPNGVVSNNVFDVLDYDLLTIGNHELYVTDIAYETFANFSKHYGEKYLTSNVQIINKTTGAWEYIGNQYRYFTTKHGLRIMAFGVLFDFTGNSNVSRVTKAEDMVKEQWFIDAVNYKEPIDLFIVTGHNPVRNNTGDSTFKLVYQSIRKMRPDVPIQGFGGHQHVRDFVVFDELSTALAAGRYCETLGWFSMSGVKSPTFRGATYPKGVPNPSQKAVIVNGTAAENYAKTEVTQVQKRKDRNDTDLKYSRRYLDWNRLTFAYHAVGSQNNKFDTQQGLEVTNEITQDRKDLNITYVLGCAPQTYCVTCKPFMDSGSVFSVLDKALREVIVNPDRADNPRLILINTGNVRFDLVQGPFTTDDSYMVTPFTNTFQYLPDVPYDQASRILAILNAGSYQKRSLEGVRYVSPVAMGPEACVDPPYVMASKRDLLRPRTITRRRDTDSVVTGGYTTIDDFGNDGDDTVHSNMPAYDLPIDLQANASFPADGSTPETVDLVFLNYIGADYVLPALKQVGGNYTESDIKMYMPASFTSNMYLPEYVRREWRKNLSNCTSGEGVE
ncbi:hypothetical protein Plec18167_003833 [Paecilomyces lecythidis]|uniref:Putative 5'-nucleotidase C-terminal domain-containing protein n=1 Tax=Paecilomyces lecythidis TaxID=3004212 RepID=A0ABR3XY42_9EURO